MPPGFCRRPDCWESETKRRRGRYLAAFLRPRNGPKFGCRFFIQVCGTCALEKQHVLASPRSSRCQAKPAPPGTGGGEKLPGPANLLRASASADFRGTLHANTSAILMRATWSCLDRRTGTPGASLRCACRANAVFKYRRLSSSSRRLLGWQKPQLPVTLSRCLCRRATCVGRRRDGHWGGRPSRSWLQVRGATGVSPQACALKLEKKWPREAGP